MATEVHHPIVARLLSYVSRGEDKDGIGDYRCELLRDLPRTGGPE